MTTVRQPEPPVLPVASGTELPEHARLAIAVADLHSFLQDVPAALYWKMFDLLDDGIYLLDGELRIRYWSAGAERISGFRAADVLGRKCGEDLLVHVDAHGTCLCGALCPMRAVTCDGQPREAQVYLRHRDGHRVPVRVRGWPVHDVHGRTIGAIEAFAVQAVQHARPVYPGEVRSAGLVDLLTGLGTQRMLETALAARFAERKRAGTPFGVVVCEIVELPTWNANHAYAASLAALRVVARTISNACGVHDTVARRAGGRFAVVTARGPAELGALAEQLRALVAASNVCDHGQSVPVTLAVASVAVQAGEDARALLARADELLAQGAPGALAPHAAC